MKINIYYGGRGLIGDPTLYALDKIQEVLKELNVTVERYDLYEYKNNIVTLPQTLKDTDGIILASTVEWYGIGGWMQQFLDACWLYGDKQKMKDIYMFPVVMSTAYGEREGVTNLTLAWEILGGKLSTGICGYMPETSGMEKYNRIFEKRTEELYRNISQKIPVLPSSNQAVKQKVTFTQNLNLTPQEAEQLSELASDDLYVQKQKEDIQELASMFKDLMNYKEPDSDMYLADFKNHYKPQPGLSASYKFIIQDMKTPLIIRAGAGEVQCYYANEDNIDVETQITTEVMNEIVQGRMTFQRAFMSGVMKLRGDFKLLRLLDMFFVFV